MNSPPSPPSPPARPAQPAASWRPLPDNLAPMLATSGALPSEAADDQWAYEMKWDGLRALVRVDSGRVTAASRNLLDMTVAYPELRALADHVRGTQALLDGEIVSVDAGGRPNFGRLQRRMHVGDAATALRLAATEPVVLLVFDLLHLDGQSLLGVPYQDRRSLLEHLELAGPAWQTPPAFVGGGADAVRASQQQGLEGVVAKRLASLYVPGLRSPDWIKIKNIRTQEVVIGGWRTGTGQRAGTLGSLLVGLPADEGIASDTVRELTYVGRVGTGFTDAMLADLTDRMRDLTQPANPFLDVPRLDARDAHWVTPRLVAEVAFAEWTADGRLRHPSWRGLRPDKRPADVVRE